MEQNKCYLLNSCTENDNRGPLQNDIGGHRLKDCDRGKVLLVFYQIIT